MSVGMARFGRRGLTRRSRPAVTPGHDAVLDGLALLRIEAFEVARRGWHVLIVSD